MRDAVAARPTFGSGWLNRTEARRNAALAMIGEETQQAV
jgi:hypothetical protein